MPPESQTQPTTKEAVRKVFSFVRELSQLKTKQVRHVTGHAWHLALAGLPRDRRLTCTRDGSPEAATGPFRLIVERVSLTPPPKPPDVLRPYLAKGWDDSATVLSLAPPDDPELALQVEALYERWAPKRAQWAALDVVDRAIYEIFRGLYDVWARLERESESWELVLADVCVSAPLDGEQGERVLHPAVLQRVRIDFDPKTGLIVVAEGEAEPRLHAPVLRGLVGLSDLGLHRVEQDIAGGEIRLNDRASVQAFSRSFVTSLFPHGGRVLERDERAEEGASVRIAPMLILMRRTPGIAEGIGRYLDVLDQVTELPEGLRRVVGDFGGAGSGSRTGISPVDVLFTKPANADQVQVVRRLESHGTVLVQGPPGTGKTHTIANLLGHLLAHGQTVLVTSQTTKALRVVREQVVEELRPLCVSVLDGGTASNGELEASVGGIVAEFTRTDAGTLDTQIEKFGRERRHLLKKIDQLEGDFRRSCELRGGSFECGGQMWTLEQAAQWLREKEPTLGWIPGRVDSPERLTVTREEIDQLYTVNAAVSLEEVDRLAAELPDIRRFVPPDELEQAVRQRAVLERGEGTGSKTPNGATPGGGVDSMVVEALQPLAEARTQGQHLEPWLQVVAEDFIVGGGRASVWTELLKELEAVRNRTITFAGTEARLRPMVSLDWPLRELVEVAQAVAAHVSGGRTIGLWERMSQPRWWTFVQSTSVDGRIARAPDEFEAIVALIELNFEKQALANRWDRIVGAAKGPLTATAPGDFVEAAWVWAKDIRQVEWWSGAQWNQCVASARKVLGAKADLALSEARPSDLRLPQLSVRTLQLERLERALHAHSLILAKTRVEDWFEHAQRLAKGAQVAGDPTGVGASLLQAMRTMDVERYRREYDRLGRLAQRRQLVLKRRELLVKVNAGAPDWARSIEHRISPHDQPKPPGPADVAIRWRRLQQALEAQLALDPGAIQNQLSEVHHQLRVATKGYVRARAWRFQRDRINGGQQQRLVGWVDTRKRIGKGTGQRAPQLIAEARRLLGECRDAVPVWIMPLAQALESYQLGTKEFDVVIIDEASQLGVEGLALLALGKRVVVVGDHEQVSPSAVGEQVAPVDALQRQYLSEIPNKHLYMGQTSLYDFARQAFGETIRLQEHFRCAREIIEFSNQLCYDGKIVCLRDTSAVAQVPPVVLMRSMGRRSPNEKVNRTEAELVVALLVAMMEFPEYRDSTFGVISLVGEEQALVIDQLVAARISAQERLRRRLICGTAAQFQGDEREVMVLSMVDSGTGQGPLTLNDRPDFKQRLNVAASRAQNQQWVVYSLNPSEDLKPQDLRRRFLDYSADPKGFVENLHRAVDAAESPFEREVIRRLVSKGYRLFPQFAVGAYRIDIVVEGATGRRLAVECDGDQWHGLDETQADLERQSLLERLGWRFHRIRGGAFYRNPDAEMQKLERSLADRGIAPVIETNERVEEGLALVERVKARSLDILAAWAKDDSDGPEQSPTGIASGEADPPDGAKGENAKPADARATWRRQSKPNSVGPIMQPIAPSASESISGSRYGSEDVPLVGERLESTESLRLKVEVASSGPERVPTGRQTLEEDARRLLVHLDANWIAKSGLLERVPMSDVQWANAIQTLIDTGRVEVQGEKRWRRYRLAGAPPQPPSVAPAPVAPSVPPRQAKIQGQVVALATEPPEPPASQSRDPLKNALCSVDPSLSSSRCPECGSRCDLFIGKKGPFMKCQDRDCGETRLVELPTLERTVAGNPKWRCGACGSPLHVAGLRARTFLECSSGHQETWQVFRDRIRGGGQE